MLEISSGITLSDMLQFIYSRLNKMDGERRYTKYYCEWLGAFKSLDVRIHLSCNDYTIQIDSVLIEMTDLSLPGTSGLTLQTRYSQLEIAKIEDTIRRRLNEGGTDEYN